MKGAGSPPFGVKSAEAFFFMIAGSNNCQHEWLLPMPRREVVREAEGKDIHCLPIEIW